MPRRCTVCNSDRHRVAFQEFDVAMLRCLNCGHLHSSYDATQDYDGYFGDTPLASADLHWWNEAHNRMYRAFCDRFVAGKRGRILDAGCGLGFFVRHLSAFPDWEATGYEISRDAVTYARGTLGLANVHAGRIEDAPLAPKSFDIITLWDVIEHIPDPDPLLARAASLLADGGILFLHTPNAAVQLPKAKLKRAVFGMRRGIHYLEARDHINVYSMRAITAVLARNGFGSVRFIHLPPIQSVSGAKSGVLRFVKNVWARSAAALHAVSLGAINVDNLFVVARHTAAQTAGR